MSGFLEFGDGVAGDGFGEAVIGLLGRIRMPFGFRDIGTAVDAACSGLAVIGGKALPYTLRISMLASPAEEAHKEAAD